MENNIVNMDAYDEEIVEVEEESTSKKMDGVVTLGIAAAIAGATYLLYKKVVKPAIKRRKDKKNQKEVEFTEVENIPVEEVEATDVEAV